LQISGGRYNFDGPAIDTAQQYAFGFTHIFTDRLVADLRAGYTRINNQSLPLNYGSDAATKIGFPGNINYNSLSSFLRRSASDLSLISATARMCRSSTSTEPTNI